MNTYIVSVYKQLPSLPQMAKDLWRFQVRTGIPIRKALEIYKRPLCYELTNKREAARVARGFRNDGTGRTVTVTIASR